MFHATTILAYKGKNKSVIGGDGQVSFGNTVLKGNAVKIRKLNNGKVLAGFAGSTADAFNLFDMFENLLQSSKGDLLKAAIDFSKEWRKDKYLRKLEAMMLEPEDGQIAAIGSGGNYALSAARALAKHTDLDEEELVKSSLQIAGEICIYTNTNIKTYVIEDGK